jgi:hypothetical protein
MGRVMNCGKFSLQLVDLSTGFNGYIMTNLELAQTRGTRLFN